MRLPSLSLAWFRPARFTYKWLVLPIALLAFIVISDLFGWRYLRGPVEGLLEKRLHRTVTIAEPFRIHLRSSIRVELGRLTIAAPAWSVQPYLVQLGPVQAAVGWGVLVGRTPRIIDLDLKEADIRAERLDDGRVSWRFADQSAESENEPGEWPRIEHLRLGDVRVSVDDRKEQLKLTARGASQPGEGGAETLIASGQGEWRKSPLSFMLRVPQVLQIGGGHAASAIRIEAQIRSTKLLFDGTVTDVAGLDGVAGKISVAGRSLGDLALLPGLAVPETPPFRINGTVARQGSQYKIGLASFDVGSSHLSADLTYDAATRPPTLAGRLNASTLVLQDLGPAIGGTGQPARAANTGANRVAATRRGPDGSARVLPDRPFDVQILHRMQADLQIDLNQLDLGSEVLKPWRSVKAQMTLRNGILSLSDLRSTVAGGTVSGSTSFDASNEKNLPLWKARLRWNQVDLSDWINKQGSNLFVAGRFNGDTDIAGRGRSTAEILNRLDGAIKGRVEGGAISHLIIEAMGLDVAQALGVFVSGPKPLPLSCALVDLSANKGRIQSNLIVLNTTDSIIFVRGDASLGSEALDLEMVSAPKDWSPLSLRAPIAVTGTFSAPSIRVRAKPIAVKLLLSALLGAVNPIAAILPLIDPGEGSQAQGCAAAIQYVREHLGPSEAQAAQKAGQAAGESARGGAAPGAATPKGR